MDEGQASVNDEFRVFYADRSPWNLITRAKGQPGHGSRLYDNRVMENLMKSVEIISTFRESQFDIVKAGKAANSEVVSVNPVYFKAGIPSPTVGICDEYATFRGEAGFNVTLTPTTDPDLFKKKIAEEWAPAVHNMTYEIIELGPLSDNMGQPLITAADDSNPWWLVFKQAIRAAGGKLAKPEILASTTDAQYIRELGIPALDFSPMTNTPILSHEHNEFLKDTIFLKGIDVYEHAISSFTSFEEVHSI